MKIDGVYAKKCFGRKGGWYCKKLKGPCRQPCGSLVKSAKRKADKVRAKGFLTSLRQRVMG